MLRNSQESSTHEETLQACSSMAEHSPSMNELLDLLPSRWREGGNKHTHKKGESATVVYIWKIFCKCQVQHHTVEPATNCFYPNTLSSSAGTCFQRYPVQKSNMLVFTDYLNGLLVTIWVIPSLPTYGNESFHENICIWQVFQSSWVNYKSILGC